MAPILISHEQQDEFAVPVVQPKQCLKSFVPVVPRAFERKQKKSLPQTRRSSSIIHEPVGDGLAEPEQQVQQASSTADQHGPTTTRENYLEQSDRTVETSQHHEHVGDQDIYSQPTYEHVSFSNVQPNGFQLPPALYPTTPRYYPKTYPAYPIPVSDTTSRPIRLSPYALDRTIVFQGEPDSNHSSPISLPSTSSTTFTQPTPPSDATSYHSQSLYQGYGHLPNVYGRHIPSKLAFDPQEALEPQLAYRLATSNHAKLPFEPSTASQPYPGLSTASHLSETSNVYVNSLGTYLLGQFDCPAYADCILDVAFGSQRISLMIHGILIAQSPTLRVLLEAVTTLDGNGRKEILLTSTNPFLMTQSLVSALRSLYGNPVVGDGESGHEIHTALASFAAGRLLQLPKIMEIGENSVLQYLTPENVELALCCALYKDHSIPEKVDARPSVAAQGLMRGIIAFIVTTFPTNFILDASAPSVLELGGFPTVRSSNTIPSVANPQLLSIRFGDFPSGNHSKLSAESVAMSRILLSVPFTPLEHILGGLDPSVRRRITRPIIDERERRRSEVLDSVTDYMEQYSWAEQVLEKVGWEERIVDENLNLGISQVRMEHAK